MTFEPVKRTNRRKVGLTATSVRTMCGQINSRFLQFTILITTIFIAVPAQGDIFMGIKIGRIAVDIPSDENPINVAVNVGYEIDTLLADLGLMAEVTRTVSSGEDRNGEEIEFESNGVYLVFKTTGPLYLTLRGGVVEDKTTASSTSDRQRGVSIGGGIAIIAGRTLLQVEYTTYPESANYLSFGIQC